jgi:hypothetical protein
VRKIENEVRMAILRLMEACSIDQLLMSIDQEQKLVGYPLNRDQFTEDQVDLLENLLESSGWRYAPHLRTSQIVDLHLIPKIYTREALENVLGHSVSDGFWDELLQEFGKHGGLSASIVSVLDEKGKKDREGGD